MIQVLNWPKFQHYKGRRPLWIKLYRDLLDRREWHELSGDASKLLAECWLVASEYDGGAIPMDCGQLAWRLRRSDVAYVSVLLKELVAQGFVTWDGEVASELLAERKQVASPEKRREELDKKRTSPRPPPKPTQRKKASAALPESWKPNDTHRTIAEAEGVDLERETLKFREHAEATGRTLSSWDAGFRTWLRRANDFKPSVPRHSFGNESDRDAARRNDAIKRQAQREAEKREADEQTAEREAADMQTWWDELDAVTRSTVEAQARERCSKLPRAVHRSIMLGVMHEHWRANGHAPA